MGERILRAGFGGVGIMVAVMVILTAVKVVA